VTVLSVAIIHEHRDSVVIYSFIFPAAVRCWVTRYRTNMAPGFISERLIFSYHKRRTQRGADVDSTVSHTYFSVSAWEGTSSSSPILQISPSTSFRCSGTLNPRVLSTVGVECEKWRKLHCWLCCWFRAPLLEPRRCCFRS